MEQKSVVTDSHQSGVAVPEPGEGSGQEAPGSDSSSPRLFSGESGPVGINWSG